MHNKQYFISSVKDISFENHNDFKEIQFGTKWLYCHRELECQFINGVLLIGLAFETVEDKDSPRKQLINICNDTDVIQFTSSWSGRWLLIYNNKIYQDASGNLQCFYDENKQCISSSLSLINEICHYELNSDDYETATTDDMDWFPGPETPVKHVKRLLGDEILNFEFSFKIERFQQLRTDFEGKDPENLIGELSRKLKQLMINIETDFDGKILLPLTAGFDSRTLLSACISSDVEFSTYTFERPFLGKSDETIPKKLSKTFNFPHQFIKQDKTKYNKEKYDDFEQHCFKQYVGVDKLYYSYGQFDQLKTITDNEKVIILRGGIWEIAREFYPLLTKNEAVKVDKYNELKRLFPNLDKCKKRSDSINVWLDNCDSNNTGSLEFNNRFYLEQRVGCWLASIEQALDITGYDRIHPVNCRDLLSILNSFPTEMKKNDDIQMRVIQTLKKGLLKLPFNEKSIIDRINRVKILGIRRSLSKIYNKFIRVRFSL